MNVKFISPLTTTQKQLWFEYKLQPDSTNYVSTYLFNIKGNLNFDALNSSWLNLEERHDAFRTYFGEENGIPFQVVLTIAVSKIIHFIDLSDENDNSQKETLTNVINEQSKRVAHLENLPLHEVSLIKIGNNNYYLLFCLHHILIDYVSFNLILKELAQGYNAYCDNSQAVFTKIPLNICEYVELENKTLGDIQEESLAFWNKLLSNSNPHINLPKKYLNEESSQGGRYYFSISSEIYKKIQTLTESKRSTIFNVLMTAFSILIYRFTRQEDFIVGYPSGRRLPGFNLLIGFFINNLPMRLKLEASNSFFNVLDSITIQRTKSPLYDFCPLNEITKRLRQHEAGFEHGIFDVVFSAANFATQGIEFENLAVRSELIPIHIASQNLVFMYDDQQENVRCAIEYKTELFEDSFVETFAQSFIFLLESICQYPTIPVSHLNILNKNESLKMLSLNQVNSNYPDICVHQLFEEQVRKTPNLPAIEYQGEKLTYLELNNRANQFGHYLQSLNLEPETLIAVSTGRCFELVIAMFGILKAGCAYLPIDPNLPEDRIDFILNDTKSPILITQNELNFSFLKYRIKILNLDSDFLKNYDTKNLNLSIAVNQLAYAIYTSGTTGQPKGVIVEHYNISNTLQARFTYFKEPVVNHLLFLSTAFDASILAILWSLLQGGKLTLFKEVEHLNPREIITLMDQNDITHIHSVPSLHALFLSELEFYQLPSLKMVIVAGENCSQYLVKNHSLKLKHVDLFNEYGPTEVAVWCSVKKVYCAEKQNSFASTIGYPIANSQIYILDELMQPVPRGVIGEMFIGGKGVARGYLNQLELTNEKFISNPYGQFKLYKTGDLARFLENGEIEYIGRIDTQIKIRGYRIELEEIEKSIAQGEYTSEEAVVAPIDNLGHRRIIAYVVLKEKSAPSKKIIELIKLSLKNCLPDYMIPNQFIAIEKMPLNLNGKIDRKILTSFECVPEIEERIFVEPSSDLEKILASIWVELLNVEKIDINDNFFELGGDSIICIQMVSAAKKQNIYFEIRDVFSHPTIALLSTVSKINREDHSVTPILPEILTENMALTPIQQWFFDQNMPSYHYYNQAMLLKTLVPLTYELCEKTLAYLLQYHTAFSLRFNWINNEWIQRYATSEEIKESKFFHYIHLSSKKEELTNEIEKMCLFFQASLNIENGPIFQAVFFECGILEQPRIFFVCHHLVIDSVSWRIFLEDFSTIYKQIQQRSAIELPNKTTSFYNWTLRLAEYAHSVALQKEISYWTQIAEEKIEDLPSDYPIKQSRISTTRTAQIHLSLDNTHRLLHHVPEAYQTQINDILISALLLAIGDWTGTYALAIDLEGHGREQIVNDIDLTRTIGWFTSSFPVRISIQDSTDLASVIKKVKQSLHDIPLHGVGFNILKYLSSPCVELEKIKNFKSSPLIFNYLGQWDNSFKEDRLFSFTKESSGSAIGLENLRPYLLEISAQVIQGQLEVSWYYSQEQYKESTIQQLAHSFKCRLLELIDHCTSSDNFGYTPCDFPLSKIDQVTLDNFFGKKRDIEDLYPLSSTQLGLLFHSLLNNDSEAYLMQTMYEFSGSLNTSILQNAWQAILDHHAIFRTGFIWKEIDQPLQYVENKGKLIWVSLDISHLSYDKQGIEIKKILEEDREIFFKLEMTPMCRLTCIKLRNQYYCLLWSHHHILLDGWCGPIILNHLKLAYSQLLAGEKPRLPIARPYRDYINWCTLQNYTEAELFWCKYLNGLSEFPSLRLKLANDTNTDIVYNSYHFELSIEETKKLEDFSRQMHLTVNTLIQGAWAFLLKNYFDSEDIIFGVTTSGRSIELQGVEEIIGLFINTLPLRILVNSTQSVIDLLKTIQKNMTDITHYSYLPLNKINAFAQLDGALSLFNTLLVFENYPRDKNLNIFTSEITLEKITAVERTEYALTVMIKTEEKLTFELSYKTEFFDNIGIKQISEHLKHLLFVMIEFPLKKLSDLSILDSKEFSQIVDAWNSTDKALSDKNVLQLFEEQVRIFPENIAVDFKNEQLTYEQLNKAVNKLAHYLQKKYKFNYHCELISGTVFALFLERSSEMLIAILAILKIGAAYTPIDTNYPLDRINYILQDTQAAFLLTQNKIGSDLLLDNIEKIVLDSSEFLYECQLEATNNPDTVVSMEDIAYVIYTSGSTGQPKGVMIRHDSLVNRITWMQDYFNLSSSDKVLQKTPYSFDVSVWEFLWPFITGATLVIALPELHKDPVALIKIIKQKSITTLHFVPSMLNAFLHSIQPEEKENLNSLKRVICSGEALPASMVKNHYDFLSAPLYNLYGPTEACIDVSFHKCNKYEFTSSAPIGKPISNARLYIVNNECKPVPIGVAGELLIGGIPLAVGYLNQLSLTNEKFIPNIFCKKSDARLYKTGDLARYLADGSIEFLGRIDRQIKLRGYRIEVGEIESRIMSYDTIKMVSVVLREDIPGQKKLVAYIVRSESAILENSFIESLQKYLYSKLPHYMVPNHFILLDDLPISKNGKLDIKNLPLPSSNQLIHDDKLPCTEIEKKLAAIWCELFKIKDISTQDNFFRLGGDSIVSIQLVSRARQKGIYLNVKKIFQFPILQELASVAEKIDSAEKIAELKYEYIKKTAPLLGIQKEFLDHSINPHYFNQSVLIAIQEFLPFSYLISAVQALIEHHQALRLYFYKEQNQWMQKELKVLEDISRICFEVDLSTFNETELASQLEIQVNYLQSTLNIENGPLFKIVLFNLGQHKKQRLLIIVHHLIIDGVSWRILLKELEDACKQLNNYSLILKNEAYGYLEWIWKLIDYSNSSKALSEIDYWLSLKPIKEKDFSSMPRATSQHKIKVKLSQSDTQSLLQIVPHAYRTRINEVLLTALIQAMGDVTNDYSLHLDLEGHGRESIIEEIDLSQTIGWFTTVFPVFLYLNDPEDIGGCIKLIKEQLRSIPNNGIGFCILKYLSSLTEDIKEKFNLLSGSNVLFNYLGQWDNQQTDTSLFKFADESTGVTLDPSNPLSHTLIINSQIRQGIFECECYYSTEHYSEDKISYFAERFRDRLHSLIEHCSDPTHFGYTVSDFPLSQLSQNELELEFCKNRNLQDIYPLAPMQTGFLFFHLSQKISDAYCIQNLYEIKGNLTAIFLQMAWQKVLDTNDILRTGFWTEGLIEPVQYVLSNVILPWIFEDWQGLAAAEQQLKLKKLMREDALRNFILSEPPLIRFYLIQVSENHYYLLMSYHHILMDGWCNPLLLKQASNYYYQLTEEGIIKSFVNRPYKQYIAWLKDQDIMKDEDFWRQYLSGYTEPTHLNLPRKYNTIDNYQIAYDDYSFVLSEHDTSQLNHFAKAEELTLNTVIQGAWALLLNQYTQQNDLMFGVTVSGRAIDLPEIDQMLGLFINTIPLRIEIKPEDDVLTFLQRIQKNMLEIQQYAHISLARIQSLAILNTGSSLFNTLIVFENYPKLPLEMKELIIERVDGLSKGEYPLGLTVVLGRNLFFKFDYDTKFFDKSGIEKIAEHLRQIALFLTENEKCDN